MTHRPISLRLQRGLTLIEAMVGLTIGMLLVAGLAVMFGNTSRNNSELEKSVRQIENGRYAIDLLTQEIQLAGYYGTVPTHTGGAISGPCTSGTALETELRTMQALGSPTIPFPVQGVIASDAAGLSCLQNYKTGTPAIVVRRLDPTTTAVSALTAGILYIQTSHNQYDNYYSYLAALGGGTNVSGMTLRMSGSTTAAVNPARAFLTRIYYIASCNDCGTDTVPTLKVAELGSGGFTVSPLVEGIENIGFDYGIDDDNNGSPDEWYGLNGTSATSANTNTMNTKGWTNVVAVRVNLLSRNTDPSSGWNDTRSYSLGTLATTPVTVTPTGTDTAYKRRAYSTTIRLNSWAGQRES